MMAVKIKKQKAQKCVMERKLNNKNCLEVTQLENKISYLQNNKINTCSLKQLFKQFLKNDKSIIKTQQIFKSERHNVFIEEISKIVLSSNEEKRMQSIDFMETYAYGMSKDLISEKEEIKCNGIIKGYKK